MKSASYSAYDQVSTPSAGATRPAGKPESREDALGKPPKQNHNKFVAEEVKGAARKAIDSQIDGINPKKRTNNSFGAATEGGSGGAK